MYMRNIDIAWLREFIKRQFYLELSHHIPHNEKNLSLADLSLPSRSLEMIIIHLH